MNTSNKSFLWKRIFFGWIPFIFYSVTVYQRAVMLPSDIPSFFDRFNDKFMHAVDYGILFWFAQNAFSMSGWRWLVQKKYLVSFVHIAFMGVLTEQAERYVEGRACSVADFIADLAGGLAVYLILTWLTRKSKKPAVNL